MMFKDVENVEAIREQRLRAEADGQVGGHINEPGEG